LISPLASQPVIEASLAIPSDLHLSGAQNAAVARLAFAPQLSLAVLQRGSAKGTPDLWVCDVIARHRAFLREILLDGLLVKERILDKSRTEAALSGEVTRSKAHASAIIVQLYIECWLRRWAGTRTSPESLAAPIRAPEAAAGAA
jgi:asparagine synthase (glutamine-hydrolysing)